MASVDPVDSAYTKPTAIKKTGLGSSDLGFTDFISLLVAQMKNQDMMNPMSDTDFIAQMAQFSALEAMNTLSQTNNTAYATSLIGKKITAASLDSSGKLQKVEGNVTAVTLFENTPLVYIGDKSFELSQIMIVGDLPIPEPPDDGSKDGKGDKD
ncbi:flagellar hook capping FlgD N-terminal domain-containing protein [Sinanaerobacter sp. ZZT-01]|uniref:flagellar hook capping FlgD N-terminal domain-containing protein n=1 Tax=Sinanaerobacter sp. ZZT-01 TaxID=3111540 RepID=UPI002D76B1C9|nr:flagellar hook capping FlgD N-terminal domain-containing protein [Sinanaerobacter sp. ZZT-01]WRR93604.1 flagellar hook capping FlgD N-terminal domain-containing protein [Sinanaerobacter sp. ZZT-01]